MTDRHVVIESALMDVEYHLRLCQFWQDEPLPPEALLSTEPFAFDTMNFPQWLQFVFLEKMYFLVRNNRELPDNCAIAPMAEEYFKGLPEMDGSGLTDALREIDRLLGKKE